MTTATMEKRVDKLYSKLTPQEQAALALNCSLQR